MKDYVESWVVLERDERGLLLKCKCKLCGKVFTADGLDHKNVKMHYHPKSEQDCWMPQCPNGCSQTMGESNNGGV